MSAIHVTIPGTAPATCASAEEAHTRALTLSRVHGRASTVCMVEGQGRVETHYLAGRRVAMR